MSQSRRFDLSFRGIFREPLFLVTLGFLFIAGALTVALATSLPWKGTSIVTVAVGAAFGAILFGGRLARESNGKGLMAKIQMILGTSLFVIGAGFLNWLARRLEIFRELGMTPLWVAMAFWLGVVLVHEAFDRSRTRSKEEA